MAAELLGAAAQADDLQALRALAYMHSGMARNFFPVRGPSAMGGARGGGVVDLPEDRAESRRLYSRCADRGGYPEGLPCQLEGALVEVAWVLRDLCARARVCFGFALQ